MGALQLAEFLSRRLVEQLAVGDERQAMRPRFCEYVGLRRRSAANVARSGRSAVHDDDDRDQRNYDRSKSYEVHPALPPPHAKRRPQCRSFPLGNRAVIVAFPSLRALSLPHPLPGASAPSPKLFKSAALAT